MSEARLREAICTQAASIFARGLTGGASGNISARCEDGGLLVSPTGASFGALDPARLARFDAKGRASDASAGARREGDRGAEIAVDHARGRDER